MYPGASLAQEHEKDIWGYGIWYTRDDGHFDSETVNVSTHLAHIRHI